MSFNGISHTTEGYPTDAYREWCEQIYIRNGRYASPELQEAKKEIAISNAYAQLTTLQTPTSIHLFFNNKPPLNHRLLYF